MGSEHSLDVNTSRIDCRDKNSRKWEKYLEGFENFSPSWKFWRIFLKIFSSQFQKFFLENGDYFEKRIKFRPLNKYLDKVESPFLHRNQDRPVTSPPLKKDVQGRPLPRIPKRPNKS